MKGEGQRVIGCPECWAESKNWATVEALGTRHNFDLVAKDRSGAVLALKSNLSKPEGVECGMERFRGSWGNVRLLRLF